MTDSELWERMANLVQSEENIGLCSAVECWLDSTTREQRRRADRIIRVRMKAGPRYSWVNCIWAWPHTKAGRACRVAFAREIARLYREQGR